MFRRLGWTAMATLLLTSGAAMGQEADRPGGAFNLRILSDSVPDFSTRENLIHSALSAWPTEDERSIAQWRWMHRLRRVGSYAPEDSRPVLDPVLFFNSYGVTYCSMIAQMNCSIWESRGLKHRVVDLSGHVVSEVFYDGAWHMFDNDFCNYFLNEKGEVAGSEELANSRIHGNVADLRPGEFYIFDHCPAASTTRGRIFMGPSSASLIEVARDWWPGPHKVRPRLGYTGSHAGHRYILGLRPNESYTRHWQPIGLGEEYARLFKTGKDPSEEGGQVLRNSRANGRWEWKPDLSDPATFFAAENVTIGKDGVSVKDKDKPAFVVLRVLAANVVTSANLYPGNADVSMKVLVSANGGVSWQPVSLDHGPSQPWFGEMGKEIAGRLEYQLKFELSGRGSLRSLRIETITQVNPRTLPALRLGTNNIAAVSDGHYETVTFSPRLSGEQAKVEVFRLAGFQGITNPTDTQPSLHSTGGDAELVLRAVTPRPIRSLRMATTQFQPEAGAEFFMHTSFDGGKSWTQLRHDYFAGWPADHRYQAAQDKVPANARDVQMKYSFDTAGAGLVNVFAEANYEPAGPFMAYDATYCWSEWRDGRWVERRHGERVDKPYHKYQISVGGTRPPRMNWVRIAAANVAAEERAGYSDGQDVGDKFARPGYRLELGKVVSRDCPYEVSRPASAAFPDVGGKTLTDGYFAVSSFWGMDGINLSGPKSERRVGELAVWLPGDEIVVTVDLGKVQPIGGARICAIQPNETIHYPATMTVETSTDGKAFAQSASVGWEECFFPPADAVVWEGTDSPVYEKLPAGGILDYRYAAPFRDLIAARYVRFRLSPPPDPKAAIGVWELEVYDRMVRQSAEDPVRLPEPPR